MYEVQILIVSLTIFANTNADYQGSIFACNHEIAMFYGGSDHKSFCDAQAACIVWKHGASIVMPKTKCLNDALGVLVDDVFKNTRSSRVWIGGTLQDTRHWTWIDGTLINDGHTAWMNGEPNGNGKERCIETKPEMGHLWNDEKCYRSQAYACQIGMYKVTPESQYSLSDYASDPKKRALNFKDAGNVCADKKSRLTRVKNEYSFLTLQKRIGRRTYYKYWLGASFKNGKWTWNDGEVLNYTNWMTGKPASNATNKCIAMNYNGWEDFDCDEAKFHFACESTAPHTLKISEERLTSPVGENMTINCSASGVPVPDVRWSYNGTEVAEMNGTFERTYQIFENGRSTLFIENASLADAGRYQCKANNTINGKAGTVLGFAELKVIGDDVDPKTIENWKLKEEDKAHNKEEKSHHSCRPVIPKLATPRVVTIRQEVTPTWAIPVVVVLSIIALILVLAIAMLTCKSSPMNIGASKANPYSVFNGKPDTDRTPDASSETK